ncbi:MAG: hypothetical protein LBQ40_00420 [Clostridiales bacterium]|jgi:hypothetical protein|nr:hypothetical protein [Clostridiales bacterium]
MRKPQHEKCHCIVKQIAAPIAGKTAIAKCPIEKFTEYIFADKYAWNGKKELFYALGFDIMDAENLQAEFIKQAQEKYANGDYFLGKLNINGQHIDIEIAIEREGKRAATFVAGWMVRQKGVITNNTPLGG